MSAKGGLSKSTRRLLKLYAPGASHNTLDPTSSSLSGFWNAETTVDELMRHEGLWKGPDDKSGTEFWPGVVRDNIEDGLVISTLGGLISYLRKLLLVTEKDSMLTQAQFQQCVVCRGCHATAVLAAPSVCGFALCPD